MKAFTYEALPGRVVFGAGTLKTLPEEVDRLQAKRALLIATGSAAKYLPDLVEQLGPRYAGTFDEVVQHVPTATIEAARTSLQESAADCVVTLGGGSAIGLGKALALETGLPVIAIPTTFSGSEMTPIYGITSEGRKKTGRDLRVLPRTVIYDPELVYSLPSGLAVTSGLNALAHCVEALYGKLASPVSNIMAEEGSRALAQGLVKIVQNDREGYDQALYGAYLAGTVLGTVGTALHHKICHVLGGTFNLPHAETHSVVLPYVVWYNREAAPEAMAQLARALGTEDAVTGIFELSARLNAPNNLAALGMPEAGLEEAARQILEAPPYNPRPVDLAGLREILYAAYQGKPVSGLQTAKSL
jgi:alcohol dehydrogenase class IV